MRNVGCSHGRQAARCHAAQGGQHGHYNFPQPMRRGREFHAVLPLSFSERAEAWAWKQLARGLVGRHRKNECCARAPWRTGFDRNLELSRSLKDNSLPCRTAIPTCGTGALRRQHSIGDSSPSTCTASGHYLSVEGAAPHCRIPPHFVTNTW